MPKLNAVGMHIYAGGFTLGVLSQGFKVLEHLEEWTFGVETVKKNLQLPVRVGAETWEPTRHKPGTVDWLYCNPPCASWSEAGRKVKEKATRNVDRYKHDGRTKCTELCFETMFVIQPTVFTWESVAAATTNGRAFVQDQVERCRGQGYQVYLLLFNGADCGLPQNRKRFFFVASKVRLDPHPPAEPRIMPAQALKGLGRLDRAQARSDKFIVNVLRHAKPGDYLWRVFNDQFGAEGPAGPVGRKGRPGFLHYRLNPQRLCITITGGDHVYHPTELRSLTVKEQQVLCGYPKDYEFVGARSNQYAQIAKAVLPPAGRWVASIVKRGLQRQERVRKVKGLAPPAELHNFIQPGDGRRFAEVW